MTRSAPQDGAERETRSVAVIGMNLELLVIPVSDVDRAKRFYGDLGWRCDIDVAPGDGFRIVQFTPPGSACSVMFGNGISGAEPGSAQGMHLIVSDIIAVRNALIEHGIMVGELFHDPGGIFHHASAEKLAGGPNPERKSYASYARLQDPDGNGWVLQEVTAHLNAHILPSDGRFTRQLLAAALRKDRP